MSSRRGDDEPQPLIDFCESLIWIVGLICATILVGLWLLLSYGWRP